MATAAAAAAASTTDENKFNIYLSEGGEIEEDLSLSIEDSDFARPLTAKQPVEEVSYLGSSSKSSVNCLVSAQRIPKNRVTYLAQIVAIYLIIIVAAVNLSILPDGPNNELWIALLASAVGCVLPAPGLKYSKRMLGNNLSLSERKE
jgi:hypothetical protein